MIQDFLGVMFSINMLKVLRLPSLKICTILLCALFFYDIFFVFITPLFMSGKSVMVEVATGHSSDEQLPMVLRVPHLSTSPSRICYMQTYSLLVSHTYAPVLLKYHPQTKQSFPGTSINKIETRADRRALVTSWCPASSSPTPTAMTCLQVTHL